MRRDPKEFFFNIKQIERHGVVLSPKPREEIVVTTEKKLIAFGNEHLKTLDHFGNTVKEVNSVSGNIWRK